MLKVVLEFGTSNYVMVSSIHVLSTAFNLIFHSNHKAMPNLTSTRSANPLSLMPQVVFGSCPQRHPWHLPSLTLHIHTITNFGQFSLPNISRNPYHSPTLNYYHHNSKTSSFLSGHLDSLLFGLPVSVLPTSPISTQQPKWTKHANLIIWFPSLTL